MISKLMLPGAFLTPTAKQWNSTKETAVAVFIIPEC